MTHQGCATTGHEEANSNHMFYMTHSCVPLLIHVCAMTHHGSATAGSEEANSNQILLLLRGGFIFSQLQEGAAETLCVCGKRVREHMTESGTHECHTHK